MMTTVWNVRNGKKFGGTSIVLRRLSEYGIEAQVGESQFRDHKAICVKPQFEARAVRVIARNFFRNA